MSIILRPGTLADAEACGQICWHAFTTISQQHNFPPDFPSADVAIKLMKQLFTMPGVYSVVAESDGKIVGSNFLWKEEHVAGVGPITVTPDAQNAGVGRRPMQDVLDHADAERFPSVRLVQAAFHNRSLSLYTKLGYKVREPLGTIQGAPLNKRLEGFPVRAATERDVEACNALCGKVHGHNRKNELLGAIRHKTATVVERNGRVTGYATVIGFMGHAVAESNDDLKALIAAAKEIAGPGLLLPTRNTELFTWCLSQGLRVTQPLTLMSRGLYNEPQGAFLPSILY